MNTGFPGIDVVPPQSESPAFTEIAARLKWVSTGGERISAYHNPFMVVFGRHTFLSSMAIVYSPSGGLPVPSSPNPDDIYHLEGDWYFYCWN